MHDWRIVVARKDKTSAPHISRQLIDFVKEAIENLFTYAVIAQVTQYEIIGLGWGEFRIFQVYAPDPMAF